MDNASPWQTMARTTQAEARDIVAGLDIEGHWRQAGAVVNAVGSFRTGLLVRHRDIDFHVYTPTLDRDLSFRVMAALASSPYLNSLHFVDGSGTEERCLEWHGIWQRPGGAPWQIDIIHIESGSTFDGYFERFADRLHGVEYYQAVLEGGVRTLDGLRRWRAAHPLDGVNLWMP